ncbi:MAG: Thiol:disulfide interchange protein DsbD [Rhodocyclaceae bacterium]|nr:MAG: protein-disulfide reductase DsbD [Rhodocyclaceae bacterium]MBV6408931.1 Thiol:disulfide interchange protein DsbD [Rhodocyclaceae bacterium]CAG0946336.1 Thiol:disulfide interchange protein DsbD [Gammaproteobacteria bacterium]
MIRRLFLLLSLCLLGPPLAAAQELLDVDKAFRLSARALDAATLEVRYDIAKGYYMYRDKFQFALEPAEAKAGAPQFPPGKVKQDEFFGDVETYRKEVVVRLPFTAPDGLDTVTLKASSQGCADIGVCYPPNPQTLQVSLAAMSAAPAAPASASTAADEDESSQLAGLLKNAGFWLILTTFFGAGMLLALTPCVFPMYPILSGIIVGHGHKITKWRAFILSMAYVLGMAAAYAAAGVAAGLSGSMLSAALQNAWVLGGFAMVFVILSLSMFGFYELQLPAFLQSKLSEESGHLKGGSLHGVAAMGALSALIVGPCVAAPLAGALLYIAQTRDAALGGAALFAMALGKGVPLVIVGVSTRSLLPHTGPWMESVKKAFGVMLLALAIWLVSPVLPAWAHLGAWGALAIGTAIFLRALDPLPPHARNAARFWKGVGMVLLLAGATQIVGALGGSRDPLQPLDFLRSAGTANEHVAFERVKTVAELETRLAAADRPVLLDFYADWCVSCKEMEKYTFSNPKVAAQMRRMTLLQVDVTANSDADKALLKRFGLFGPPGILFFDRQGKERPGLRVVGYLPADKFIKVVNTALGS